MRSRGIGDPAREQVEIGDHTLHFRRYRSDLETDELNVRGVWPQPQETDPLELRLSSSDAKSGTILLCPLDGGGRRRIRGRRNSSFAGILPLSTVR
jgi:hypothetical protein